jgi:hypothetical protein
MRFPIARKGIIPKQVQGAGDLVAKVAEPIKRTISKVLPYGPIRDIINNCGCDRRREALNQILPFVG